MNLLAGPGGRMARRCDARVEVWIDTGHRIAVEGGISYNVQRETTFPKGMSRRQAAPAMPPGAEA